MKSHYSILTFIFFLLTNGLSANPESIFAAVEFSFQSNETTGQLAIIQSNAKMRIDLETDEKKFPKTSTIVDIKSNSAKVLLHERQVYFTLDYGLVKMFGAQAKNDVIKNFSVIETPLSFSGETQEILGLSCRKYIYESETQSIEVWLTTKLSSWLEIDFLPLPKIVCDDRYIGFPIEIEMKSKNSSAVFKLTPISSAFTAAPDHLFVEPEGYRKISMFGSE